MSGLRNLLASIGREPGRPAFRHDGWTRTSQDRTIRLNPLQSFRGIQADTKRRPRPSNWQPRAPMRMITPANPPTSNINPGWIWVAHELGRSHDQPAHQPVRPGSAGARPHPSCRTVGRRRRGTGRDHRGRRGPDTPPWRLRGLPLQRGHAPSRHRAQHPGAGAGGHGRGTGSITRSGPKQEPDCPP